MNTATDEVLVIALLVGGLLILVPLVRARHDVALKFLAAVLVLYGASRLLSLTGTAYDAEASLALNLLTMAASFAEVCFFRTALEDDVGRDARAIPTRTWFRLEVAVATSAGVVAVVAWLLAAPPQRAHLSDVASAHGLDGMLWQLSVLGYLAWVSGRAVFWSVRLSARITRAVRHVMPGEPRGLRAARIAFVVGVVLLCLAEATRAVSDGYKVVGAVLVRADLAVGGSSKSLDANLAIRLGHTVFIVAVFLPLLADAGQTLGVRLGEYRRRRRSRRALAALWGALLEAFPNLSHGTPRTTAMAYYRCDLETRDGVALLWRHYRREVAVATREAVGAATDDDPRVVAALVRAALSEHWSGADASADPQPVPCSGARTREGDLSWLVRVAEEFDAGTTPHGKNLHDLGAAGGPTAAAGA